MYVGGKLIMWTYTHATYAQLSCRMMNVDAVVIVLMVLIMLLMNYLLPSRGVEV